MYKNRQSGITLIALVITIIVLLILAGVTIAMLSGNNSAPQKATEAAQKDAIAAAKDEIAMEVQEALLNYYNNTYVSTTATGASTPASTQEIVQKAAKTAVDNVKGRNKELLTSSTVERNSIKLYTKSYQETGTIGDKGGITWSGITSGGITSSANYFTLDGQRYEFTPGWTWNDMVANNENFIIDMYPSIGKIAALFDGVNKIWIYELPSHEVSKDTDPIVAGEYTTEEPQQAEP